MIHENFMWVWLFKSSFLAEQEKLLSNCNCKASDFMVFIYLYFFPQWKDCWILLLCARAVNGRTLSITVVIERWRHCSYSSTALQLWFSSTPQTLWMKNYWCDLEIEWRQIEWSVGISVFQVVIVVAIFKALTRVLSPCSTITQSKI